MDMLMRMDYQNDLFSGISITMFNKIQLFFISVKCFTIKIAIFFAGRQNKKTPA